MSIYLETNALRKLTNYTCKEPVYTSIFSIFELLSGITEEDFKIRKACLKRIKEQKIEIRSPMIDKLFMDLLGINEYNKFADKMIMDIYEAVLKVDSFSCLNDIHLLMGYENTKNMKPMHALTWLKNWDNNILTITKNLNPLFEDEDKVYIKSIYKKDGISALAKHFWNKFYNNRVDKDRISHAEAFIGLSEVEKIYQEAESLFCKYNFKLFIVGQAVVFAKVYFINGNTQNSNNASDLLHLLYLNKDDKFISNDKIYQTVLEACPEFQLIVLNNEKNLFDLI
ncbi:hypothetical protein HMPREF1495_1493 [Lachnoanaerobaculum sp. MSX33]|uniref:hypothetical protein n=1 Tax=Lachnoanaerobaculum sp. MSX33 TaxID=936596 RepID=UPI0003DFB225|nr:hypothetical protein [Lachnoanaerobaculum sp. MSX33]ETO98893.1 hypothetical protein HMPREF1495_1493 [Lachnoanaerobaculum sp. MSX33]